MLAVTKILFVEHQVDKNPYRKEFAFGPDTQPAALPVKGDVWSFNCKGDDLTDFVVDGREFQEGDEGEFGLLVRIRKVPRLG